MTAVKNRFDLNLRNAPGIPRVRLAFLGHAKMDFDITAWLWMERQFHEGKVRLK